MELTGFGPDFLDIRFPVEFGFCRLLGRISDNSLESAAAAPAATGVTPGFLAGGQALCYPYSRLDVR